MDDLEFRRRLFAEPNAKDGEFEQAKNESEDRQKLSADIDKLDNHIAQALNMPVPDDLCDRLILRQTLASHQQTKKKSRVHLALAASVTIAVGVAFNFLQFSSAYNNLGDYALAHTYHEVGYFSNSDEADVTLASLNNKMASFDGSFTDKMGDLIFADYCRFDGMKSLHLVFRGESSPVNVYIVPQNEDLAFSKRFSDKNLSGKSISFKDKNIIIVGDHKEPLEQWKEVITSNLQWSI